MKNILWLVVTLITTMSTFAQSNVDYLTAKPLANNVVTKLRPFKPDADQKVSTITWGGDIATVYGVKENVFKKNGLDITLVNQDDLQKQTNQLINGEIVYVRGTMSMMNMVDEAIEQAGGDLSIIYQLTWSVGGDAMVVRPGKNLKNIKTIGMQLYGPHIDYATNLFEKEGRLSQVKFKYLKNLTISNKVGGKAVDPVTAFQMDPTLDAVMCIIPDALLLTSNGSVGTGSDGSVKGAQILVSTKTTSRVICDVYAVRSDYLQQHPDKVEKFTKSMFQSTEGLQALIKNKNSEQGKYRQVIASAAEILMGSSSFTADTEAMLADCEFAGYPGNVAFFTGQGTNRNITTLTKEIQSSYTKMGLMKSTHKLDKANWNYKAMASGLSNTSITQQKPKFDQAKVQQKVEEQIYAETTTWEEEGTLFVVEINFAANQTAFDDSQYALDFAKALDIAETNSGALVVIEGHSDPLAILKAERAGTSNSELNQMRQKAKNLSLTRAETVRKSFLSYCKRKGINIDESQFLPVGLGANAPKYNPPKTKEEWAANRRVVFRIKQVEAELDEFTPLN